MSDKVWTTHENVVEFFGKTLFDACGWNRHTMINPILDLQENEGTGQWMIHALATTADDPQHSPAPIVVYGRYFDEYVRTSDGWKFRKTRFVNDTRTGINP